MSNSLLRFAMAMSVMVETLRRVLLLQGRTRHRDLNPIKRRELSITYLTDRRRIANWVIAMPSACDAFARFGRSRINNLLAISLCFAVQRPSVCRLHRRSIRQRCLLCTTVSLQKAAGRFVLHLYSLFFEARRHRYLEFLSARDLLFSLQRARRNFSLTYLRR